MTIFGRMEATDTAPLASAEYTLKTRPTVPP
jgi:hypothetical protein